MPDKNALSELSQFIRTHRNNESHFEILYNRMLSEYEKIRGENNGESSYADNLREAIEKHAALYKTHFEKSISTWSEFETAITAFEKSVTDALHEA